jgi:hypothetical protein
MCVAWCRAIPDGSPVLTLLCVEPITAQEIKDPAELMPAKTLANAEIRHAGKLVKEVGALLKDSALGNVPDSLLKFRTKFDKGPIGRRMDEVGVAGLMFAPEVIAELGRLQGAASVHISVTPYL